jgi:hypothetical protein
MVLLKTSPFHQVAIRARNYPYVLAQLSPAMGFLQNAALLFHRTLI